MVECLGAVVGYALQLGPRHPALTLAAAIVHRPETPNRRPARPPRAACRHARHRPTAPLPSSQCDLAPRPHPHLLGRVPWLQCRLEIKGEVVVPRHGGRRVFSNQARHERCA